MIVGFTGTRAGMTTPQKRRVEALLRTSNVTEAHHGDCIGADDDFHDICLKLGVPVIIHPPKDSKYRAWCEGATYVFPPKDYLVRNKDIVNACRFLIACPKEVKEPPPLRGQGTWSTVRYGRNLYREVSVVWPV